MKTPGPWQVYGTRQSGHVHLGKMHMVGPDDDPVAAVFFDPKTGRGLADAHLIAAAPDMYAALKAAFGFIRDEYADPRAQALEGEYVSSKARPVWHKLCDALAKADAGMNERG